MKQIMLTRRTFESLQSGWRGVHADMFSRVCSSVVTQVEFLDGTTLVSSSIDGSTRLWDTVTGAPKDDVAGDKFAFSKEAGREQRVGQFLVTAKDDLLLVHDADGAADVSGKSPVAFFRAPAPIDKIDCAGHKISVSCTTGAVLLLRAAWLAMTS